MAPKKCVSTLRFLSLRMVSKFVQNVVAEKAREIVHNQVEYHTFWKHELKQKHESENTQWLEINLASNYRKCALKDYVAKFKEHIFGHVVYSLVHEVVLQVNY